MYFICPVFSKLTHLKIYSWRREAAEPGIRDSEFVLATTSRAGLSKIRTTVTLGATDKADVDSIVCLIEWRNREAAQQSKKSIMWTSVTREVKVVEQERQQGRKCETESEECQGLEVTDKRGIAPAELSETYNEKNRGRENIFVYSPKRPNQLWDTISLLSMSICFFFLEKCDRGLILTTHL